MVELTDFRQLHHYTDGRGLLNILASGNLRFSSYRNLNDPRETKSWSFAVNQKDNKKCNDSIGDETLKALETLKNSVRVCCFSIDSDLPEGTPKLMEHRGCSHPRMWAHYADNHQGACLVFDREKIVSAIEKIVAPAQPIHDFVIYRNRSNTWEEPFVIEKEVIEELGIEEAIRQHVDKHRKSLFFEKAMDWESENEYRFIVMSDSPDMVIVPIMNCLKGVILGHRFRDDLSAIRNLLRNHPVQKPYRMGWINGFAVVSSAPST